MEFLKREEYVDAKNFAGECEPAVIIAKGQSKGFYLLLILTDYYQLIFFYMLD